MSSDRHQAARDELGLHPEALPRHVAIIMDGNGRWARGRGLPREEGHRAGVESVRAALRHCAAIGVRYLTLYSFSSENWKRPEYEVNALMTLCAYHLAQERGELMQNGVRLNQIGRRDNLPDAVLRELDETARITAPNSRVTLTLALNYGSRDEIVDAIRTLVRQAQSGDLQPEDIDIDLVSRTLYTADLPDPDLVIRTAGEMRLSNFLLWQVSYAEFYATSVLWPDFRPPQLDEAIRAYASRERRYGAVLPPSDAARTPQQL